MGKKVDKFRKESRKDSTLSNETTPPKIYGCPIPEPIECTVGKAIFDANEGILMECTNKQCPFHDQKVHEQCFALYEDHLIKKIATMGSARGWTEQQRRANLWEKKGQSLIAKSCRCRCGLGTTKRDEMAHYNKALEETAAARRLAEAAKRKPKTNNKQLPQLNYPLLRGAPSKEPKEKRRFMRNDSLCSDASLDEAYTYHRDLIPADYRANSVISSAPTIIDLEDTLSTCSRNEVFLDTNQDLVPAPMPPPITRTYAAAIRNKYDMGYQEQISPAFNGRDDSGLESKGESPLLSFSKLSSHSSSGSENFNGSMDLTPMRPQTVLQRTVKVKLRQSKYRENIVQYRDNVGEQLEHQKKQMAHEKHNCTNEQKANTGLEVRETATTMELVPDWCPLFGRGFNLAETLLANVLLPGLIPGF